VLNNLLALKGIEIFFLKNKWVMKRLMAIALFAFAAFTLASCDKTPTGDEDIVTGKDVEIYLLKSFTKSSGKQIDESSVVLESTPLIRYADITYYNKSNYTFGLTEQGKKTIFNMEVPVGGLAFGVTVNKELIYTGYFWPSYFSSLCNWVYTDSFMGGASGKLSIKLGIIIETDVIPDNRNNSKILTVMARDGKLKE
jgi:predicted small secreted protein